MKGLYEFSLCNGLTKEFYYSLFFESTFVLYYILNGKIYIQGKMQIKKVFQENLLKT